jgi:hypothetical protein
LEITLPVFVEEAGGIIVDVEGNHLVDLAAGIAVTSAHPIRRSARPRRRNGRGSPTSHSRPRSTGSAVREAEEPGDDTWRPSVS